jgi:biopolymer transport protein ExbD
MGMSGGGGRRAVPFINVTPLIDVLLVLLIIFMVVTPFKPKRFKTLIPEQQNSPPPQDATPSKLTLRVDITKNSTLLLNNEDHDPQGRPYGSVDNANVLRDRIYQILQDRERNPGPDVYKFGTTIVEKTVYVKAPESFKYGDVVKVIDAVKSAGADPVGLQVDCLPDAPTPCGGS